MSDEYRELLETQLHFGLINVAPIEKDLQVVQVIKAIAAMDASPFTLVFGGGTALARAHRAIRRMSEDVDFKIVAPDGFSESRSKLRNRLSHLRDQVTQVLIAAGFPGDLKPHARNENHYLAYQLPYSSIEPETRGLRPTIQLELTYSPLRLAPVGRAVSSFVAEVFGRTPEVEQIACVSITETAAEKLVALTRRTAMVLAATDDEPYDDETLIRHIYDLHSIQSQYDAQTVVNLARAITHYDADVFAHQYPAFRADPMGEIRKAMEALESDPVHALRYQAFEQDMVYGDHVSFSVAFSSVKRLAELLYIEPLREPLAEDL